MLQADDRQRSQRVAIGAAADLAFCPVRILAGFGLICYCFLIQFITKL